MSDYDNAIFRLSTEAEPQPEDYTGENGLLYCGSCRQPKEAYFTEGKSLFGRDRHPKECDCQRKRREKQEATDRERKHRATVEDLKRRGFSNAAMRQWTFENDNGKCPQMDKAFFYVAHWDQSSFFIKKSNLRKERGRKMSFFTTAVTGLKTVVTAIGAGVAVWGVINLLEGYGNDNPGANAHVR